MKKSYLIAACVGLSACVLNSSCIGSFSLFNKFKDWNLSITNNRFFNCLLGFIFTPVYGLCLTVDWIALNTIEFWTGSPALASVGETKRIVGTDGNQYVIVTEKDGYRITNENNGEDIKMEFDNTNSTWSIVQNDESRKIFRLNEDNTVTIYMQNGEEVTVTKDQEGIDKINQLTASSVPFILAK